MLVAHTTSYSDKPDPTETLPGWCKQELPPFNDAQAASLLGLFAERSDVEIWALKEQIGLYPYLWAVAADMRFNNRKPLARADVVQLASQAIEGFGGFMNDLFMDLDENPRSKKILLAALRRSGLLPEGDVLRRLERARILERDGARHKFCFPIMETYLRSRLSDQITGGARP